AADRGARRGSGADGARRAAVARASRRRESYTSAVRPRSRTKTLRRPPLLECLDDLDARRGRTGRLIVLHGECTDRPHEFLCLMLELLSRLSYLLRHFRILLGNLVHSRDGAIDLFDAGMLLAARRVDLGHDVAEL